MALKSDATHWGSVAKAFHWTIVVLILVQATVGLVMTDMPKRPNVIPVFNFHKSLGLTILLLAILRLAWRAFDRRPAMPATMAHWQANAARAGHVALYALLFAVPLSGWLFDSASSLRPLFWWGLVQMPSLVEADKAFAPIARDIHVGMFWALAVVAAGHAVIAIVHHVVNRDDVLTRMLPGRRKRPVDP